MTRLAIVYALALAVFAGAPTVSAGPHSHGPAPKDPQADADATRWREIDAEVATLEGNDAKAALILERVGKALFAEHVFTRVIAYPCAATKVFYVEVLTDPEHPYNWNAHWRGLAAWGLGSVGGPEAGPILKMVAAEDPTTDSRAGKAPMRQGNARAMAKMGLNSLASRFPEDAAGW